MIFLQDEAGILNVHVPFLGEGCLNKFLVGQEIILLHPTRICIEVHAIIIFKHLQLVAKHKHKPITIEMLYKRKLILGIKTRKGGGSGEVVRNCSRLC